MTCPFKDNQSLKKMPCSWYTPDGYPNFRICDVCQRNYRLDEIAGYRDREGCLFVLLLIIFVAAIMTTVTASLNNENSQPEKDSARVQQIEPRDR